MSPQPDIRLVPVGDDILLSGKTKFLAGLNEIKEVLSQNEKEKEQVTPVVTPPEQPTFFPPISKPATDWSKEFNTFGALICFLSGIAFFGIALLPGIFPEIETWFAPVIAVSGTAFLIGSVMCLPYQMKRELGRRR